MRLARALEDKKFDLRLRDKFVADKKLESKEVEDYMNNLENDEEKLVTTGEKE
ncbi:MAG: hypothetical protein NXH75_13435 [Halobacteriovoraceae bacterium]|jgi:hypothetical protein|nr:hypothetical protein [Halobacteriovoraceae bacterium]